MKWREGPWDGPAVVCSDTYSAGERERWAGSTGQEPFPALPVSIFRDWVVARKSSFGTHSFFVVISEGPFLLVSFPELTPLKGLQIQNLSKWSWQFVYYRIRKNPYLPREGFYFLMF